MSDAFRAGKPDTFYNRYTSLQSALYAGPFFAALSFATYLFGAIYIDEDKKKVLEAVKSKIFFEKKLKKIEKIFCYFFPQISS